MEIGSGERSSSARSEKMEKDGDRQKKMEGHCSTGQSSHRAVVPVEEEEEEDCYSTATMVARTRLNVAY
jgi:hypothetical protein